MNKIAAKRKEQKITQKELGAVVGAAQNTISNWETGKREPDYESLKKMASYFGCSIDCLLGLDTGKGPHTVSDEQALDRELILLLTSLTSAEQEKVDAFARGLIANRGG